jgi:hypothetical protein
VHGLACYVFIVVVCALHFGGWVDLSHLVWLSYERLGSDAAPLYSTGPNDLWFVAFWVILLTGLRVVVQGLVYKPIGACGCLRVRLWAVQPVGAHVRVVRAPSRLPRPASHSLPLLLPLCPAVRVTRAVFSVVAQRWPSSAPPTTL